jgi:hypothetical protein
MPIKRIGPYESEYAFRVALETRLRNVSQECGMDLQRLQRTVAFERLLARLFAPEHTHWLLKGGYAQEMRFPNRARSTGDIDLSLQDSQLLSLKIADQQALSPGDIMFEHLQIAADLDLGDGFRFTIRQPVLRKAAGLESSARFSVEARLAGRPFARFHVDVGWADPVVGIPEWTEGNHMLDFAGIPPARVALYPLEMQFAEKFHAYTHPWRDRENTRVKDLVDIVLLIHAGQMDSAKVKWALETIFRTRNTHPLVSDPPAPPDAWAQTYQAMAQELDLPARTLSETQTLLGVYWKDNGFGGI